MIDTKSSQGCYIELSERKKLPFAKAETSLSNRTSWLTSVDFNEALSGIQPVKEFKSIF